MKERAKQRLLGASNASSVNVISLQKSFYKEVRCGLPIFFICEKFLHKDLAIFCKCCGRFCCFLSQFHDLKSPDIILEVTSVKAISSQPIDLVKFSELSSLKEIISGEDRFYVQSRDRDYSPEEMDRILINHKNNIASMSDDIDRWEKSLGLASWGLIKNTH